MLTEILHLKNNHTIYIPKTIWKLKKKKIYNKNNNILWVPKRPPSAIRFSFEWIFRAEKLSKKKRLDLFKKKFNTSCRKQIKKNKQLNN